MASVKYKIKKSKIHGKGVFAKKDILTGEKVGLVVKLTWPNNDKKSLRVKTTQYFGKWINHSSNHNSELKLEEEGWNLYAIKDISKDEEIFGNYDDTKNNPKFIEKSQKEWV